MEYISEADFDALLARRRKAAKRLSAIKRSHTFQAAALAKRLEMLAETQGQIERLNEQISFIA